MDMGKQHNHAVGQFTLLTFADIFNFLCDLRQIELVKATSADQGYLLLARFKSRILRRPQLRRAKVRSFAACSLSLLLTSPFKEMASIRPYMCVKNAISENINVFTKVNSFTLLLAPQKI
jgi:hypothetical protein